jgi:plasmid stabilization system protein ParE
VDHQVRLAASARADLRDIVSFIASDSPDRAQAYGEALLNRIAALSSHPRRGRVVPELGLPDIREVVYRSHRIVYRLDAARRLIEVIRIWHAARGEPELI